MANSKRDLFQKRRLRVRNKLRKMADGRPRSACIDPARTSRSS